MGLSNSMSEAAREALWTSFLERWPLEKLRDMTLEQYTCAGAQDSFTYWLESKTEALGSVLGGSSFKFGIFHRKGRGEGSNEDGRMYTEDYAWYSKYGSTPESAFRSVHQIVLNVANAARRGDLNAIDTADLGHVYKWKIAFLYQDRPAITIVPIFKKEYLNAFLQCSPRIDSMPTLQQEIVARRGREGLFEFATSAWNTANERLNEGALSVDDAFEFLNERFTPVGEPSTRMAGFETDDRRQLALVRDLQKVLLFLAPGSWGRTGVKQKQTYAPEDDRHAELSERAPQLAPGHGVCSVEVSTMQALESLCDDYEDNPSFERSNGATHMNQPQPSLNQILYGPPGTGKTFHCVTEALRIIDPEYLKQNARDRSKLKTRFDELVRDKRVRLVTFHQSFSYEDFVEGIRAKSDPENPGIVTYSTERGVFTEICDDARLSSAVRTDTGVRQSGRVWKLSIGRRQDTTIREACFERGEARIGWGYVGDLSDPNRPKKQIEAFEREGDKSKHSLMSFYEGMSKGDIVLCLKSQSSIEAVGVVQSDYEFDDSDADIWSDYFHRRKVNWLATGLDLDILPLNGGVGLTQKTIYELPRIAPADALALVSRPATSSAGALPYVLIIDEINRGNISKIFGELITLLEPSKRAGAPEALEVVLPYSKRSFSVPSNVHVIGTMNTADRSLATLDIALRRRFTFVEMPPRPEELSGVTTAGIDIAQMVQVMNQRIEVLLDRDHALGHAYFLRLKEDPRLEHLAEIFRNQIFPLLQEYFFEDWERIRWVLNDHRKQSASHQFVVRPDYDVKKLLGQETGMPNESKHWRINEFAFAFAESFRGIVEA